MTKANKSLDGLDEIPCHSTFNQKTKVYNLFEKNQKRKNQIDVWK